jgi:NADPH:quinone reductase-like Zn-dependent oxidoreductase
MDTNTSMKAAIYTEYGPPEVLHFVDMPKPEPGPGEVLIRVCVTTASAADARIRGFNLPRPIFWIPGRLMLGILRPRYKLLGVEFAGVVEKIGEGVTNFAAGDEVFAHPGLKKNRGGYAEYVVMGHEESVAKKPTNLTLEESVCLPFGGLTALYFLKKLGNISSAQRILVVGASGSVGSASVQLAKHFGAHVTGVCSTENVEFVESLGADEVIDYKKRDYTRIGGPYDIVFDTVGATKFTRCKGVMAKNGTYLAAVMGLAEIVQMLRTPLIGKKRVRSGVTSDTQADILLLKDLAEAGELKPVMDSAFDFVQIVEAHHRVDQWRKRGNVVIRVADRC